MKQMILNRRDALAACFAAAAAVVLPRVHAEAAERATDSTESKESLGRDSGGSNLRTSTSATSADIKPKLACSGCACVQCAGPTALPC
jgi:hypothetical protein